MKTVCAILATTQEWNFKTEDDDLEQDSYFDLEGEEEGGVRSDSGLL